MARVFGLPPGCDMAAEVVRGLDMRLGTDPAAWARTTIYVNSGRTAHDLGQAFQAGPARLLPRVLPVTAAELFPAVEGPGASALSVRLDLVDILADLLDRQPGLAPRAALYDLAGSLAALLGEMDSEGVSAAALAGLDVAGHAAHWQVNLSILQAIETYLASGTLGPEAVQRRRVEALVAQWQVSAPADPVLVVGSTGSRGTTRLLMEAVARLPQGAVILPGFDFDQPGSVWAALSTAKGAEDHPQARFEALTRALGIAPADVAPWTDAQPPAPQRARLVSLSLRPAPVTDQWMAEGKGFAGIDRALADVTLIKAPTPRAEAEAIACAMRLAFAEGKRVALIAPDRTLARRVAAALGRWGLVPDDSAGRPLHLTAPGRLLRQTAEAMGRAPSLAQLLALCKHPLTASAPELRGPHMLQTREFELFARRQWRGGTVFDLLADWGGKAKLATPEWVAWVQGLLAQGAAIGPAPLAGLLAQHRNLAEAWAAGPGAPGSGALWQEEAGRKAQEAMEDLARDAGSDRPLALMDYLTILDGHLQGLNVRQIAQPHAGLQIIGPIEARSVQADLVILSGLNEGTWPAPSAHDPWLNRPMRAEAGLLSPERRIGLSAHDYAQATCAQEVILARAIRSDEAETVPSRWLSRLMNLTRGISEEADQALQTATKRGDLLIAMADGLDAPEEPERVAPAVRPAPRPPVEARPTELPVTAITKLIRDPYAVYAERVLGLRPLLPLNPVPDARLRGILLHEVLEAAVYDRWPLEADLWSDRAAQAIAAAVPETAQARTWLLQFQGVLPDVLAAEDQRRAAAAGHVVERSGALDLPDLGFTLKARPDRIDKRLDGTWAIYDYKTGTPPSDKLVAHFEKQLVLEAAMLERGGFAGIAPGRVEALAYIGIGSKADVRLVPVEGPEGRAADLALAGLKRLIERYLDRAQGYTARRAPFKTDSQGDYDHLARFGEWEMSDAAQPQDVGP